LKNAERGTLNAERSLEGGGSLGRVTIRSVWGGWRRRETLEPLLAVELDDRGVRRRSRTGDEVKATAARRAGRRGGGSRRG
jgi:hypothetical protein